MCFVTTGADVQQYWNTDLTTPRNISRIVYQSRQATRVNGAQIRAGLSANMYNNPVLATVTYVADYILQEYDIDPPILARYIGITGPPSNQLELCKMMAFE